MFATIFSSCEKIITVKINDIEKQYVIQGQITDTNDSCEVLVSTTMNIFDSSQFVGIGNAVITIDDNNGNIAPFVKSNSGNGVYKAKMKGIPGRTYSLEVQVGDNSFTATSTMPNKVLIDSIFSSERIVLGKLRKFVTVAFKDPAKVKNQYRFIQLIDGFLQTNIFVLDDKLVDGNYVFYELFDYNIAGYTLKAEDYVQVRMRCIDFPNYMFWYSASQSSMGNQSGANPGNPQNNIQGGALGYFSAHTNELSKTITIPPIDTTMTGN